MSPPAWRCCRLVRLLAVLWTVGGGGARQSQPSASGNNVLEPQKPVRQQPTIHDITPTVQPLISKIVSRIEKIESRMNRIQVGIKKFKLEQSRFNAGLDALAPLLDSMYNRPDSKLDQSIFRGDSAEGRRNSGLREPVSRVDGLTAGRSDNLESDSSRLDERLDELFNRRPRAA